MKKLSKKVIEWHGKNYYLLGEYDKQKYWLEQASWDCGWYWGFGYIEVFNKLRTDIILHTHYDSMLLNSKNKDDKYIYIFDDIEGFNSVLSREDQYKLTELMKGYYTLRDSSDLFHGEKFKDTTIYKKINNELLPQLFQEIYLLLSK